MAETELDKAMIVNWALVEIGLAPNFSIDDATKMGDLIAIFWPRCLSRCFGLHDWTFCRRTLPLTRQSAAPENGWPYGFDLPGDRIGPPLKLGCDPQCRTPIRDFDIEGDTVYSREPVVFARCKVALEPSRWPPQFADAFAIALASYLAVPLTQDPDTAAEKAATAFGTRSEAGAGGVFGRLIAQDRAAAPIGSPILDNDPLTAGRFSGPWHGNY